MSDCALLLHAPQATGLPEGVPAIAPGHLSLMHAACAVELLHHVADLPGAYNGEYHLALARL